MLPTSAVFMAFGGLAVLIHIGMRYFLSFFISYGAAIILAYLTGMGTAFILFKFFVFKAGQSKKTMSEIIWFMVINILTFIQTLLISIVLKERFFPWIGFEFHPQDVAHIIGVLVPAVVSYFGHNLFTFRTARK